MTLPLWEDLAAAQQKTLLTCPNPEIGTGLELLNFADLSVVEDLSDYLQLVGDSGGNASVSWDGTQTVPRSTAIGLGIELNWGTALVRLYRTISDPISGVACRKNRGVFDLTTPDRDLGEQVTIGGVSRLIFAVTGQDRSSLLDRLPGYSLVALKLDSNNNPVPVITNLAELYAESGVPVFFINSTASLSQQPRDMTWPLLSFGADDTSSTDTQTMVGVDPAILANLDSGNGATFRQALDDLHSLISYRAVWCDSSGALQSTPYTDPAVSAPTLTIDATVPGTLSMQRSVTQDVWGVPNQWTFYWSNMPNDADGNPQTPQQNAANDGTTGVIILRNEDEGPSAINNRYGLVYNQTFSFTAATADDFAAQCAAKKAKDLRVVTTYKFSLHPSWCVLEHFDVATLIDPQIPGGSDKVQIQSWGPETGSNDDIPVVAVSV